MRTPFVAGNWKMNKTAGEARQLVSDMLAELTAIQGVEKVLCPPFTSLSTVSAMLKDSGIGLGAQNLHWEASGAYTGEISPPWWQNSASMSLSDIPSEELTSVRPTRP